MFYIEPENIGNKEWLNENGFFISKVSLTWMVTEGLYKEKPSFDVPVCLLEIGSFSIGLVLANRIEFDYFMESKDSECAIYYIAPLEKLFLIKKSDPSISYKKISE